MRVAIVGGGWAGLAAAVAATEAGHDTTVYEAARTLGGRARSLEVAVPGHGTLLLDNGQHIMIAAYVETLRLMEKVGVHAGRALLRLPLALRFPDGKGLALPGLPPPWDAVVGIARARGWSWSDRLSLLRAAAGWRRSGFTCPQEHSIARLCEGLTPRVRAELIEPLCVSALNTPPERASGQVFLRVIADALFSAGHAGWAGSNLLVPRQDLGRLFPLAAQTWLMARQARVRTGHRVQALEPADAGWRIDDETFDEVVLACPPWEAARLAQAAGPAACGWREDAGRLQHEAIATVYATGGPRLPLPMLALRAGPDAPAQFVFDRGQLGGPAGLLGFVVSASQGDRQSIERRVLDQAQALGWKLRPAQTVIEKRATFACTPGLRRPGLAVARGLWACGDYVDGPYPATLEGAVRSALGVVARLGGPAVSASVRKAG